MSTRMEKYDQDTSNKMSRLSRNTELYKTINKNELDNYEIKSNATVLGSNKKNQIDVEQIKKILDTRYKDNIKRKSIRLENDNVVEEVQSESTKEYDINAVIEKARGGQTVSYEEDRVKKLRNTQFNILNDLKIDQKEEVKPDKNEAKLMDLINTISINENKKNKESQNADLDLFQDLQGDENTEVYEGMKEKIDDEISDSNEDQKTINLDNTVFSQSVEFNRNDFVDLDLDSEKISPIFKIMIALVIVAFLIGVFFLLKTIFNF